VLPVILWKLHLPFVMNSYGEKYLLFELFGLCGALFLIVVAYLELKKCRGQLLLEKLPLLLLLLVGLHYLVLISEYSTPSWDYSCYENAGKAILKGESPYTGAVTGDYLYPPLPAQALALVYRLVSGFGQVFPPESPEGAGWYLVFYLYQCMQFFLLLTVLVLCYRFARRLGLNQTPASLLVAALFIFNTPLVRTLRHNQINLYILALILIALLYLHRRPALSGMAAALGGHLKLYPLVLLFPWAFARKVRPVVYGLLSFAGILAIQIFWGQGGRLWPKYLSFAGGSSGNIWFLQIPYFRDNSLHSLVFNLFRVGDYLLGVDNQTHQTAPQIAFYLAVLAVLVWFTRRFLIRERTYRSAPLESEHGDRFRMIAHSLDALALMLIISPLVWEHQYVLALPLVIWAAAVRGLDRTWPVWIAAFLMFALPVFDVLPLSYHRLAGLVMILWLAKPDRMPVFSTHPAHFA
jgi:hypothetical protein